MNIWPINYDKIDVPKKDNNAYTLEHFSDKEDKKINEIFDELGR